MISGFPITSSRCEKAPYKGELSLKRATGLLDPQVRLLRPTTDSKSGPVCHSLTETSTQLNILWMLMDSRPYASGSTTCFIQCARRLHFFWWIRCHSLSTPRSMDVLFQQEAANSSEVCRINECTVSLRLSAHRLELFDFSRVSCHWTRCERGAHVGTS